MSPTRVARINVTPVKSLRLQHPDEIALGPDGAHEDRRFLLVDDGRRLYNGKRDTSLVRASATWDPVGRRLGLTMPDGAVVEGEAVPVASDGRFQVKPGAEVLAVCGRARTAVRAPCRPPVPA